MADFSGNETDVREEVATPLLAALGYARGTENDILRELSVTYDKHFLGRKKNNDPPLRGRADYVLAVNGAARWVLEIKAPSEDMAKDDIEQAISYARHPEIAGTYAGVLNGRRFVLFHSSQPSSQKPLVDVIVSSPKDLADRLAGILSPAAIRRDCSPPKVDLERPLGSGLRSKAGVRGGMVRHSEFVWRCNAALPTSASVPLEKMCAMMRGYRSNITGGHVWRDETSRIRARLDWAYPHEHMLQFAREKKLMEYEYVALGEEIAADSTKPTAFDVVGRFDVAKGEVLFSILRWESNVAGVACQMTFRGQATGHLVENRFVGSFQVEYEASYPSAPGVELNLYGLGDFEVVLDP